MSMASTSPYLAERRRQGIVVFMLLAVLALSAIPAQNTRFLMSGTGDIALSPPSAFAAIAPPEETEVSRFVRPAPLPFAQPPRRSRLVPTRRALAPAAPEQIVAGLIEPPTPIDQAAPILDAPANATDVPGIVTQDPQLAFATPPSQPTLLQIDEEEAVVPGPVPEPSTWAMLVFGFGLLGAQMRRRRLSTFAHSA
jgi:hypothetical protein